MNHMCTVNPHRLILVAALTILTLTAACTSTSAQEEREPFPTFIPAGSLVAAPTPPDDRAVLVVTIVVHTNPDGSLRATELEHSTVINSYAPNVFDRSGPWTVELSSTGERGCDLATTVCFGIEDPRWIEVENPGIDPPFSDALAERVEWRVPLPLHHGSQDLNITSITILDQAGEVVIRLRYDPASTAVSVETPEPTATPTLPPAIPTSTPEPEPTLTPDIPIPTPETESTPTATPEVIVRRLFTYDEIEQQILPDMAAYQEDPTGGQMELTILLEPDVVLATGVDLISERVAARMADEINLDAFTIDAITAIDDHTLVIEFARPGLLDRFLFSLTAIEFKVFAPPD